MSGDDVGMGEQALHLLADGIEFGDGRLGERALEGGEVLAPEGAQNLLLRLAGERRVDADEIVRLRPARERVLLEDLSEWSSTPIARLRDQVQEIYHEDWSADPFSGGAYSYPLVRTVDKPHLLRSVKKRLYFAGEAFHEEMSGTVEGALTTGRDSARSICRNLN